MNKKRKVGILINEARQFHVKLVHPIKAIALG